MAEPTREEIDAKIAASEVRTDTKFAELLRHIDGQTAKLESVERSTAGVKTTVIVTGIGTVIGLAALGVAILARGDTLFGLGLSVSDAAEQAARRVAAQQSAANEQLAKRAAAEAVSQYRHQESLRSPR
ncbi:MAG: hypothetical protein RIQ99_110 [Pseudomonadota bacterium]